MGNFCGIRTDTLKVIQYIVDWFSEEELTALAIASNRKDNRAYSTSFKEQLIARYCMHRPIFDLFVCKAQVSVILSANRNIFDRLMLVNSEAFQAKIREDLNSIDSFTIKNETKINWKGDGKAMNLGQSSASSLNRASSKSRGGSADSGQEYIAIDKLWDAEDMKFLNHGSPLERDLPQIEKIENADETEPVDSESKKKEKSNVDSYRISLTARPDKQYLDKFDETNQDDPEEMEKELGEDQIALYSVASNQSRSKVLSNTKATNFSFLENSRKWDTDKTKTFTSRLNTYQKFFSLHVKDLREVAFKKLDVLFVFECPF